MGEGIKIDLIIILFEKEREGFYPGVLTVQYSIVY